MKAKLVKESLNEIQRNKRGSGLGTIGIGRESISGWLIRKLQHPGAEEFHNCPYTYTFNDPVHRVEFDFKQEFPDWENAWIDFNENTGWLRVCSGVVRLDNELVGDVSASDNTNIYETRYNKEYLDDEIYQILMSYVCAIDEEIEKKKK